LTLPEKEKEKGIPDMFPAEGGRAVYEGKKEREYPFIARRGGRVLGGKGNQPLKAILLEGGGKGEITTSVFF